MDETIVLTQVIEGELPFTLNLPDGSYPVLTEGKAYELQLQQNRILAAVSRDLILVGRVEDVRTQIGAQLETCYVRNLRTIVRNSRDVVTRKADLPAPTPKQLFEAAQTHLLRLHTDSYADRPIEIQAAASEWLSNLSCDERDSFSSATSLRLAVSPIFPHTDIACFCDVVNVLIRLYMATFSDRFVQEVTENMFSATAMRGLRVSHHCDGRELDVGRHVGGYCSFMIAGPWWTHPEPHVASFRSQLGTSPAPDPVSLLHVRAQSMLLRGVNRSAMVEASAAFDLCLVRKIRAGFLAKGKTDPEIEKLLEENRRYEQRAKGLLKQATGKSAPEVNNTRWERFQQDRRDRGTIAHSATEPDTDAATAAVENMIELTQEINRLPV